MGGVEINMDGVQVCCWLLLVLVANVVSTTLPEQRDNNTFLESCLMGLGQVSIRNQNLENVSKHLDGENKRLKIELARNKLKTETLLNVAKRSFEVCSEDLANVTKNLQNVRDLYDKSKINNNKKRSCKEWKEAGYQLDGDYVIDPDGHGSVDPFFVSCMFKAKQPNTIMHHESENMINAGDKEAPRSNVRNVVYRASLAQIVAVIERSEKCHQYIRYDCIHSEFDYGIKFNHAWYSRTGARMDYWGGAAPGSKLCACGMTRSCDSKGLSCNCDKNDHKRRADFGFLTDKNALPVTKMAFGDLGDDREKGYHTLGPVQCW